MNKNNFICIKIADLKKELSKKWETNTKIENDNREFKCNICKNGIKRTSEWCCKIGFECRFKPYNEIKDNKEE